MIQDTIVPVPTQSIPEISEEKRVKTEGYVNEELPLNNSQQQEQNNKDEHNV